MGKIPSLPKGKFDLFGGVCCTWTESLHLKSILQPTFKETNAAYQKSQVIHINQKKCGKTNIRDP